MNYSYKWFVWEDIKEVICIGEYLFNSFSHHSKLLSALSIKSCEEIIKERFISLLHVIFNIPIPIRKLCMYIGFYQSTWAKEFIIKKIY